METFPPHLTLPSPEVWGLCSWPGWEVGEAGIADLVFGKQWGSGVGSERELRDLGKRQALGPGTPPHIGHSKQFIKIRARVEEKGVIRIKN